MPCIRPHEENDCYDCQYGASSNQEPYPSRNAVEQTCSRAGTSWRVDSYWMFLIDAVCSTLGDCGEYHRDAQGTDNSAWPIAERRRCSWTWNDRFPDTKHGGSRQDRQKKQSSGNESRATTGVCGSFDRWRRHQLVRIRRVRCHKLRRTSFRIGNVLGIGLHMGLGTGAPAILVRTNSTTVAVRCSTATKQSIVAMLTTRGQSLTIAVLCWQTPRESRGKP